MILCFITEVYSALIRQSPDQRTHSHASSCCIFSTNEKNVKTICGFKTFGRELEKLKSLINFNGFNLKVFNEYSLIRVLFTGFLVLN